MVNFGAELDAAKVRAHSMQYIDYAMLKQLLEHAISGVHLSTLLQQHELVTLASRPVAQMMGSAKVQFLNALEHEISKVSSFAIARQTSLLKSLQALRKRACEPVAAPPSTATRVPPRSGPNGGVMPLASRSAW